MRYVDLLRIRPSLGQRPSLRPGSTTGRWSMTPQDEIGPGRTFQRRGVSFLFDWIGAVPDAGGVQERHRIASQVQVEPGVHVSRGAGSDEQPLQAPADSAKSIFQRSEDLRWRDHKSPRADAQPYRICQNRCNFTAQLPCGTRSAGPTSSMGLRGKKSIQPRPSASASMKTPPPRPRHGRRSGP